MTMSPGAASGLGLAEAVGVVAAGSGSEIDVFSAARDRRRGRWSSTCGHRRDGREPFCRRRAWPPRPAPSSRTRSSREARSSRPVAMGRCMCSPSRSAAGRARWAKPPGWSTPQDRGFYSRPAIDGDHVFATSYGTGTDVFTPPASGWAGVTHQTAVLSGQGFLSFSGPFALGNSSPFDPSFGQPVVLREPAGGWSGAIRPAARLYDATPAEDRGAMAIDDSVAVLSSDDEAGSINPCPCDAEVSVFTRPTHGWAGTLAARSAITTSQTTGLEVALDHATVFTFGGEGRVIVYRVRGTEGAGVVGPNVTRALVTGLKTGTPALQFVATAAGDDPPIGRRSTAASTSACAGTPARCGSTSPFTRCEKPRSSSTSTPPSARRPSSPRS